AQAATLALQVRPRANQARALIALTRQLDLKLAFLGARTQAENLEDQARTIHDLGANIGFQITLLHRRERRVDHDHARAGFFGALFQTLHAAAAQIGAGADLAQRRRLGVRDVEAQSLRQPYGLQQARFAIANALARRRQRAQHDRAI